MNFTSFETRTIADTVAKINVEYFIPAIQRPYVWEVEQIEKLFDSLMKEYPISTFLLWKPPMEEKGNWHTYKFLNDFRQGDIHNDEADLESVSEIQFVLDGQQRLTSIYLGLCGAYRVKAKYKRKTSESSYARLELFLDLLKNPDVDDSEVEEDVEGVTYGFKFLDPKSVRKSKDKYWFKVGDILRYQSHDEIDEYVDQLDDDLESLGVERDVRRLAKRNLKKLHSVVWDFQIISTCTVKQPSYDKVLDIFVRTNDGGTKLSKSDLLMSLVTLNWQSFNARDELVTLLDDLNINLATENNFDRDFLLRASLLLTGLKYVFKVDSFTKENLALIESNWTGIKSALILAVSLVNSFGLSNAKGNLSSSNSVMPIAYYAHALLKKYSGDVSKVKEILASNRATIRHWLVSSLFCGVFAGAGDQTVVRATKVIGVAVEKQDGFPSSELAISLVHRRKGCSFDDSRVDDFLSLTAKDRVYKICLQLLYTKDELEQDDRVREYIYNPNEIAATFAFNAPAQLEATRIANMLLLTPDEYQEFKMLGVEEWIATRNSEQRSNHLLPALDSYEVKDFMEFVAARKKLIEDYLKGLIPVSELDVSETV